MTILMICLPNNTQCYCSLSSCKTRDFVASLQVALRWLVQRDVAVVPKSNSLSHQKENISVSNSSSALSGDHCHCRVIHATVMPCHACNTVI